MLPRGTTAILALLLVLTAAAGAQTAAPVRYHFGDDADGKLGWANPSFDDSAWPAAENGRWPVPAPFAPDGFEWTRMRVPVPGNASGPLAIRMADNLIRRISGPQPISFEIFVNGRLVAQKGTFPPDPQPVHSPAGLVFELPAGLVQPGTPAVVAYRVWFQAGNSVPRYFRSTRFEIGESAKLLLANHAEYLAAVIAIGPLLAISALIGSLGIGLLVFWRWIGGRELLFGSVVLLTYSLLVIGTINDSLGIVAIPWRLDEIWGDVFTAMAVAATVEFMWAIHSLHARILKRVTQAGIVGLSAFHMYDGLTTASLADVRWSLWVGLACHQVVIVIIVGTNLWPLFTRRKSWLVGMALAITPIGIELLVFGISADQSIGPFYMSFLDLGYLVSYSVIFLVLGRGVWRAWRARDELRVEFEAAREVQQRMVAPPGDIPGFKIDCVYQPAKQVGGDFFRVTPEGGGSVLIVVGDVSGKGLSAAMTVSAVVGALRSIPPVSPAWILNALNCGLAGQMKGGFVTCCVARIKPDGDVTIANAGHLSPYLAGAEVPVSAGLPLGLYAGGEYEETHFLLSPDQPLTFLSDGVVEARNAAGELFGFERTLAISNQGATEIARAATNFGQDDDITVLTLLRESDGGFPGERHSVPSLSA